MLIVTRPSGATVEPTAMHIAVLGQATADNSLFAGPGLAPGWHDSYVSEGSVAPVSALEVDEGKPGASI